MFIKWFGPMILRYFLKRMGKKFQQQFQKQSPFGTSPADSNKEKVIDRNKPNKPSSKKKVGEYIDYEEID